MSPQPAFRIPLDVSTAGDPKVETLGMFKWRERNTRLELECIAKLESEYEDNFGPVLQTIFSNERNLRDAHVEMLQTLMDSGGKFSIGTEVSLDQLGEDGEESRARWLESDLHRRYLIEVVKIDPHGATANTKDMKDMDLVIYRRLSGTLGMLAELKLLRPFKAKNPVAFHAVWRECFYQAAWYLAGAHYMVGTRLALAVVNSSFQRLHMSGKTLSVEVHAKSTPAQRRAATIADLEASAIWNHGMPHDFQDGETYKFKDREFAFYRDTYAQGAILTANMEAAQPGGVGPQWTRPSEATGFEATVTTSFGYDDQVHAADLKVNEWQSRSKNARKKPQNPPPKTTKGRKPGGGAGGSSAAASKKQQGRARKQHQTQTTQGTATRRSDRIRAQASRSKKRRSLSVIFPWPWFRHNGNDDDDHDNFPPASQLVPPVLADLGYTIRLVTPQEMDKLVKDSVTQVERNPARTAAPAPATHHPRPTAHRPMPNTHRPTPASLRPTPTHHGRMHTTHHPMSSTHRPMPTAHRPWPPSPVHGHRQGYPVSGMGRPSRMTAAH